MGGTKSAGTSRAPGPTSEPSPGTPEWARAKSPGWLREEAPSVRTSADLSRLTRRLNRELDQGLDRQNGWTIGAAKAFLDQIRESLAANRAPQTSTQEARADRILRTQDSSGRRRARR